MSGFITSTGLDLDSIFQQTIPTPIVATDLTVVPPTGFRVGIQDLASRYRPKGKNTYLSGTNFRRSGGVDLLNLFEWGGYDPSFGFVQLTSTGKTASIEVSGNYYTVDISGTSFQSSTIANIVFLSSGIKTSNPFKYTYNVVDFGQRVTFRLKANNGFSSGISAKSLLEVHSIDCKGLPKFNTITLLSVFSTELVFSLTGQNYKQIKWEIVGGASGTTTNNSNIPPSSITIPLVANIGVYNIIFTPINEFNEEGQSTTKILTYRTSSVESYAFQGDSVFTSPSYLYKVALFIVAGGGSGGSGGNNSGSGTAGGGGGGGSGGFINDFLFSFFGEITTRQFTLRSGYGGAGAGGVGGGSHGNAGNDGLPSKIQFDVTTFTATGGAKGDFGRTGSSAIPGTGGPSGTPPITSTVPLIGDTLPPKAGHTGIDGGAGGAAGAGGNNSSGFGSGSSGSAGDSGAATEQGGNGYTKATFHHVVMT